MNRCRDVENLDLQVFKTGAIHRPSSALNDIITATSH